MINNGYPSICWQPKKNAQKTYLQLALQKNSTCWTDFSRCVKRRKGNRENIPAIKDYNDRHITIKMGKTNPLNSYYSSVFGRERKVSQMKQTHPGWTLPF